ncbi:MAG TPA: hypothetical protein VFB07_08710 [Vicinamibacterales bacterium]|nr:hypothetical protein [Vicinamibacterales bacterium]
MHRLLTATGALVVSALCAAPARGQTDPPPSALKVPTVVWAAGAATDWMTTYRFSSAYGDLLHESNPLIRGLDRHPAWLVAAGASIDAATWWTATRFFGRTHPRWTKAALYGGAAFRVYLAAYNIGKMREAQAIRDARGY